MLAFNSWSFWRAVSVFSLKMGGRGEPQYLDDFAAVSRAILRAGPRNLAKFSAENCGPYRLDSRLTLCVNDICRYHVWLSIINISQPDRPAGTLAAGRDWWAAGTLSTSIDTHRCVLPPLLLLETCPAALLSIRYGGGGLSAVRQNTHCELFTSINKTSL